jgi:hypothetical protein
MSIELELSNIYSSITVPQNIDATSLAQRINQFVREKIQITPNYLSQCPRWAEEKETFTQEHPELIAAAQEQNMPLDLFVAEKLEEMLEIATCSQALQQGRSLTVADIALAAHKYQSANCVGMSALGFFYPHADHLIEMFSIRNKNNHKNKTHTFLVIDRDQASIPEDHLHWGENATVCDPWMNSAFKAAEIPNKLFKFARQTYDESSRRWITHVDPFDPGTDELTIFNPLT